MVGNLEEDLAGAGGDVKVLVFEGEFLERFADEVERVLGSELVVLCPLCVEAKQVFFHSEQIKKNIKFMNCSL